MRESRYDVVGIGNALVDVQSRESDAFIIEHGLNRGSMTLIDEDRAKVLYDAIGTAREESGGSAANTLAGVASFGGSAAFIGKVRNDQLGDIFVHDIRATGVDFWTASATKGPQTGCSLIVVTEDGERTMNTYLGAAQNLSPEDVDPGIIQAAKVTYLEGYLWDPPLAKDAFLKAAGLAHAADRAVSLSLSDPFCVDRYREEFTNLVHREIDILFANEDELLSLYQTEDLNAAIADVRKYCALAAVTRSARGSIIITEEAVLQIPADPVASVVDSTGAGDQYAAGFLFGWSQGMSLQRCGALGSAAAAEVIQHFGARPEIHYSTLL